MATKPLRKAPRSVAQPLPKPLPVAPTARKIALEQLVQASYRRHVGSYCYFRDR